MRLPPAIAFGLARSLVWAFRLKPPARVDPGATSTQPKPPG